MWGMRRRIQNRRQTTILENSQLRAIPFVKTNGAKTKSSQAKNVYRLGAI